MIGHIFLASVCTLSAIWHIALLLMPYVKNEIIGYAEEMKRKDKLKNDMGENGYRRYMIGFRFFQAVQLLFALASIMGVYYGLVMAIK
jgi:hypothetical protein